MLARSSAIPYIEGVEATSEERQLTTVFEDLASAKISNLYPKFAIEEEILRFKVSGEKHDADAMVLCGRNVPMNDILVVHVLNGIHDLGSIVPRARQGQRSHPRYPRLHLAVWCQIEHKD